MQRLLFACCLAISLSAIADINIPIGQQGDASLSLPAAGASKSSVLEHYGLPDDEHPPVGSPAITRWDFREFSVYFQDDRVISSVRHHQPQYPQANP